MDEAARRRKNRLPKEQRLASANPLGKTENLRRMSVTKLFAFALTLFPKKERAWQFPATQNQIGSRRVVSCWRNWAKADRQAALSISGATSRTFSISRFMANGFATKPRTPTSRINSCARSSSPLPEIKINGGTDSGGFT